MPDHTLREQLAEAASILLVLTTLSIPLFILGEWLRSSVGG